MRSVPARIVLVLALAAGGAASADVVSVKEAQASIAGRGDWHTVPLPDDWERSFPETSGMVDYRLRFDAPVGDHRLQGVYIQRACTNLAVYLNGELIGSGGRLATPVTRNCYYPFLFSIPSALLRERDNELNIRLAGFSASEVSARQRAAGLSEVRVGPLAELQPLYDNQLFWNITAAQIIAAGLGSLGAAMLVLAAMRRRETYLAFFGFLATGWAGLGVRLFERGVVLDNVTTEILICAAFPPVLGCAYQFLLRLVERRHVWVDQLLVAQALVVPCLLFAAAPRHLFIASTVVYNVLAIEFVGSVVYFMRTAWREFRQEFWLMGSVLLVALLLSAIEIALQDGLLPLPKVHVIHFVMPFLFVVIGLRLIQQFVRALNRAETLNAELERRVAEKSLEIESNWQQIASLRTAEAAQRERQRIASDLHDDLGAQLLTIAQGSTRWRDPERIAVMAREALDEMRLSVRGMVGESSPVSEVLADWRAETVSRLAASGLQVQWHAQADDPQAVMPARTLVQLTRVLREVVSNAIRHSGGTQCRVRIDCTGGELRIEVEDDGCGLRPGRTASGNGMGNIQRRVRLLGGRHDFGGGELGGTRLQVRVPLAGASVTAA